MLFERDFRWSCFGPHILNFWLYVVSGQRRGEQIIQCQAVWKAALNFFNECRQARMGL